MVDVTSLNATITSKLVEKLNLNINWNSTISARFISIRIMRLKLRILMVIFLTFSISDINMWYLVVAHVHLIATSPV